MNQSTVNDQGRTATTHDIEETKALADEAAYIFRVHEGLRNANEKAYTPILISIGPYHPGEPKLRAMEKRKEHYLELFLQRNTDRRKKDYLNSIKESLETARKYYADPVDHLPEDEFVNMMLYDGCFVIEFLLQLGVFFCDTGKHRQSHVGDEAKVSWKRIQICSDLMLLENQLPFFVISDFYNICYENHPNTTPTRSLPLTELALLLILENLPGPMNLSKKKFANIPVSKIKHFLDLVRNVHLPTSPRHESNNHQNKNQIACFKMRSMKELQDANNQQNKNQRTCIKMPCVIELQDAGVKFKAVEDDDLSMFDIRFEHGHFKIPTIKVTEWTETFFRNMIAYEQHSSDDEPKYFTDYTSFMGELINSKEDVTQLRRHEVLENWLGDDEVVALMFNNLDKGTNLSKKFYYAEQGRKVNAHCKRRWNRGVASLKRDYFKNIWVTVATIAAAFLLIFTLTQTVISLITIIISPLSRH